MMPVVVELRPPAAIDSGLRQQMFELMTSYYESLEEASFVSDLEEKDFVILLSHDGTLIGFSTALVGTARMGDQIFHYLFSGDTVVSPDYWGPGYLLHSVFKTAGWIKAIDPERPLYWFLIVKGHRTYRILSTFFRRFVPGNPGPIGDALFALRDLLGSARFGAYYDPETGLIDFGTSRGHIAPHLQDAPALAATRNAVRDFALLNPDHARGVELACIGEFSESNLRSYARQRFREGLNQSPDVGSDNLRIVDPPGGLFTRAKAKLDRPSSADSISTADCHGA